jgi:nuclear control of ATPase protein 2
MSISCRMLIAFCEQTKGQMLPPNATDQQLMEIVMSRHSFFISLSLSLSLSVPSPQYLNMQIPMQIHKMHAMNLNRYEKEMMHPVQNLFNGELARAMLIQVLF